MANEQLVSTLNQIAEIVEKENTKHYWMVRTDDGANYKTFAEGGFVALNLRDYPTQFLTQIEHNYPDVSDRIPYIKETLITLHREGRINLNYIEGDKSFSSNIGRLAKQIAAMAFLLKRDDIVLIPDHSANRIKIGKVVDDGLVLSDNNQSGFSYVRKVEWVMEINKYRLDPCLYKALGAHQAICDITKYAEYIERNYNSYFNINDKYHYVLAVNAENISAWKLSSMVCDILDSVKSISEENNLEINVERINFTINVNSPGKFSFVTNSKNAVLIMAIVASFSGGTIKYDDFEITTNGAFLNLVDCVNSWKNAEQERKQKAATFDACMKSLEMQSVEATNEAYDAEEMEVIEEQNLEDTEEQN